MPTPTHAKKKKKKAPLDPNSAKAKLQAKRNELAAKQKELEEKIKTIPNHSGKTPGDLFGGKAPFGTSGALGEKGYSITKMAAVAFGTIDPSDAKEEIEIHNRLKKLYKSLGFTGYSDRGTWLVPFSTNDLPTYTEEGAKLATEIRQKMAATVAGADFEAAAWHAKQAGYNSKSLSTINDVDGGFLRGFPTIGELIELQRNKEVFSQAGASQVTLPPNGLLSYPKQTSAATAYFIGEAKPATLSQPSLGNLDLRAKKLVVMVQMTNDLLRFASPSIEALVRSDMAIVSALRADLAMLEGEGPSQIHGLIRYPTTGNDRLTIHSPVDVPADANTGYLFQPEDVELMESELPDAIDKPTAWVLRRDLWGNLINRRADAVAANDERGMFVFYPNREAGYRTPLTLADTQVIRSRQVSNTRKRGTGPANLTYAILGYFPDWIIARMGVMEFVSNSYADSVFGSDQTQLRGIQYIDAGARHPASFNFFDNIRIA